MISRIDLKTFWNLFKSGGNIAKTLRPIVASSLYDWIKGERTGITYQEIDSLLSVIDDAAVALINNSSLLATAMYNDNASRLFAPTFSKNYIRLDYGESGNDNKKNHIYKGYI